ncbi:hypothetical protein KAR91_52785 [Candidatus Pacearchaeota archaeon]|nr:hypothetical protein [Candidatus Pacearchaeota archaeon]
MTQKTCRNCKQPIDETEVKNARAQIPENIRCHCTLDGKCGPCTISHAQQFTKIVGGVMDAGNRLLADIKDNPPKRTEA